MKLVTGVGTDYYMDIICISIKQIQEVLLKYLTDIIY